MHLQASGSEAGPSTKKKKKPSGGGGDDEEVGSFLIPD